MAGRDDFLQWLRGLLKGSDGITSSSAGTKAVDEATALTDNVFTMKPKSDYDETIESLNKTKAEFDDHIQAVTGPMEDYMTKTTEFLEGETWTQKYFRNRAEDYEMADHMYKYGLYDRAAYLKRLDEIENEYNAARYEQVVSNDIKAGNKVKEDPYKDVAASEGGLHPILDESEVLPEPSFMQNEGAKIESFSDVQKRRGVGPFADDVKDNVVSIDDGKAWNPNEFDANFNQMKKDNETGLSLIKKGIDDGKITAHDEADFFNVGEPVKIGVQNEDAMWKVLERELYDIDKARTPYGTPESMLADIYNDIQSGTRYGIANEQQRLQMLERIKESMRNYDMTDYFPEDFADKAPFVIKNGKKITASGVSDVTRATTEVDKVVLDALQHKKLLDDAGIDTSNVDWDILMNSDDLDAVKAEAIKLQESLPLTKALEADSALAQADVVTVQEMMEEAKLSGSETKFEEGKKLLLKIKEAYEESIDTGVYKSPLKKRTEHATGGRIGFADGDEVKGKFPMTRRGFLGTLGGGILAALGIRGGKEIAEQIVTKGTQEVISAPGMPNWFPLLVKKIRQKGTITRQSDYKEVKDEGIDIIEYKLQDPSLPTGSINMTEDLSTGEITIWGRGDELQVVDLTFTPGTRSVDVETGRTFESPWSFDAQSGIKNAENIPPSIKQLDKHPVAVNEQGTFEAGEFYKGHEGWGDIENFGGMDDLQGGVSSWSNIVKTDVQRVDEATQVKNNFLKKQKGPIEPNMATGGRVGLQEGGILGQLDTNQQASLAHAFNLAGQAGAQQGMQQVNTSQPTLGAATENIHQHLNSIQQQLQQNQQPMSQTQSSPFNVAERLNQFYSIYGSNAGRGNLPIQQTPGGVPQVSMLEEGAPINGFPANATASTINPANRPRPEDYILQRGYANGGLTSTVPPQRGPLTNGIGTRFKERQTWQ